VDGEASGDGGVLLGLVCAMPEELGSLRDRGRTRPGPTGLELLDVELPGGRVLAAVSGVGKVLAARAAAALLAEARPDGLLVVGVCGGLRSHLAPGELVHCERAVQADLAVRAEREQVADPELAAAWRRVVPGHSGWFLTADRPVISPWRRLRLARAFAGDAVADMETAAVSAVAARAGVPWAALRAVTDRAGAGTAVAFRRNFPVQAGRAADSVPDLVALLGGRSAGTHRG
jgi:adenosylhomocysteine nucleosidase